MSTEAGPDFGTSLTSKEEQARVFDLMQKRELKDNECKLLDKRDERQHRTQRLKYLFTFLVWATIFLAGYFLKG